MIEDRLFQAIDDSRAREKLSRQNLEKSLTGETSNVLDLFELKSGQDKENIATYSAANSVEVYENFLDWLFQTFDVDEKQFRESLVDKLELQDGQKVLITGCGIGGEVSCCLDKVGKQGEVHAQDLSKEMVLHAASGIRESNVLFTISNAMNLPYRNNYFDAVFHFGGINLFGDVKTGIAEMARVCRKGGVVVFGDEGIAPHLIDSEYGKIAINNIPLWNKDAPIKYLPTNSLNISLDYILGNCFYLIRFTLGNEFPYMDIDVDHKGIRGGSARTRYFGQVEGVTEIAKAKLYEAAHKLDTSAHRLLTDLIEKNL
jgi:ubiquinone/menaquinone biosynthesis C-methylase UbiE